MHRRSIFSRIPSAKPSSAALTDEGVLRALRNGQNSIWQEFLNCWSPRLYSYALYNTHSVTDAQKLLQAVFVLVTKTILQSNQTFNLTTLIVSALYRALLQYQQNAGLPTRLPDHVSDLPEAEETAFVELFATLAPVARHVLLLRYVVGLELAELATVTGQSMWELKEMLRGAAASLHPLSNG